MSNSTLVGMERAAMVKCLKDLERVKGIEPSSSAWKAVALPLSYTRIADRSSAFGDRELAFFPIRWPLVPDPRLVGEVGLEPTKP
jgi:hypothetical protein